MKRFRNVLAAAAMMTMALGAVGCGDNLANTPSPGHPGKLGSGTINATYQDTINLATGTVFGPAHYIGSIDTVGIDLFAASGTAACTVAMEVAVGRYNPATSSPTDDTLWNTYAPSGWTAPASLSGAVSNYYIEIIPISGQYLRPKFVCSSGSTSLTVSTQVKGG